MDAESTIECNCELCSPNWFLGRDDELVAVPQTQVKESDLEVRHALKVRQAGLAFQLQPQQV